MTLVYPKDQATLDADAQISNPRTHVLAIGVGRYPHLLNGSGPPADGVPPLGQLTSPPASAREFATWFTSGAMHNDAASLGSVEILLSDPLDQTFAGAAVESATFANIANAFKRWADRCDLNERNVGVFYFCGHGLQKINMLILPEDFGAVPANPWLAAIDFDQTYKSMSQCAAKTQVYIVDACRQVTSTMIDESTVSGQALRRAYASRPKTIRTAPKLYATAEGLPAFGDGGQVSRFTRSVLTALAGGGARKLNGKWSISTHTLPDAVRRLVELENQALPSNERQYVSTDGEVVDPTVLHTLSDGTVPNVTVMLGCTPDEATDLGKLIIQGRSNMYSRGPTAGPWATQVPAGVYSLYAEFSATYETPQPYPEEWIEPPVFPYEIAVKAKP